MIGVYAGSFDPFTNGHLAIADQASCIFDKVILLVANNSEKRHWFTSSQRKEIIEKAVADEKVEVHILNEDDTAVNYAFRLEGCLVRGLGEFTDYPAEKALLGVNSRLRPEVKTVFLMTRESDSQMRSSTVREAIKYRFGWRGIRDTVPRATFNAVILKLMESKNKTLARLLENADLSRYLDRPYHNLEHLIYMMDTAEEWDKTAKTAHSPDMLAAVLYHDLLVDSDPYTEQGQDVTGTVKSLAGMELPGCSSDHVAALILATDHRKYSFAPPAKTAELTPEQNFIRKLDLAILGESPYEYGRYARAVREEYAAGQIYPGVNFLTGRIGFLKTVLRRLEEGPLVGEAIDGRIAANVRRELEDMEKTQ